MKLSYNDLVDQTDRASNPSIYKDHDRYEQARRENTVLTQLVQRMAPISEVTEDHKQWDTRFANPKEAKTWIPNRGFVEAREGSTTHECVTIVPVGTRSPLESGPSAVEQVEGISRATRVDDMGPELCHWLEDA